MNCSLSRLLVNYWQKKVVVNITNMTFENKSIVINCRLKIPTDKSEIIE